jgi:hypothetical protein
MIKVEATPAVDRLIIGHRSIARRRGEVVKKASFGDL